MLCYWMFFSFLYGDTHITSTHSDQTTAHTQASPQATAHVNQKRLLTPATKSEDADNTPKLKLDTFPFLYFCTCTFLLALCFLLYSFSSCTLLICIDFSINETRGPCPQCDCKLYFCFIIWYQSL
jgi:hypothetical protein